MNIKKIKKENAIQFKPILKKFLKHANNILPSEDELNGFIERVFSENSTLQYIGCFEDEKIVGIVSINWGITSYKFSSFIYCDDLFVEEEYRKRGIAKALMNEVVKMAKIDNCSSIMLGVGNEELKVQKFYKSIGFNDIECKLMALEV